MTDTYLIYILKVQKKIQATSVLTKMYLTLGKQTYQIVVSRMSMGIDR